MVESRIPCESWTFRRHRKSTYYTTAGSMSLLVTPIVWLANVPRLQKEHPDLGTTRIVHLFKWVRSASHIQLARPGECQLGDVSVQRRGRYNIEE